MSHLTSEKYLERTAEADFIVWMLETQLKQCEAETRKRQARSPLERMIDDATGFKEESNSDSMTVEDAEILMRRFRRIRLVLGR